jgi:hypothetical protein
MKHKEEKKIQFGGWSKSDYREIRSKLRRIWLREFFDLEERPRTTPATQPCERNGIGAP